MRQSDPVEACKRERKPKLREEATFGGATIARERTRSKNAHLCLFGAAEGTRFSHRVSFFLDQNRLSQVICA